MKNMPRWVQTTSRHCYKYKELLWKFENLKNSSNIHYIGDFVWQESETLKEIINHKVNKVR